jgi:protein phosphatase
MPIGEFSERSGLSQKRLRTYAAAGLLVPAAVDSDTGYRYYGPGQLRDARLIDALRRADVPLSDIATALRDPTALDQQHWQRQLDSRSAARQAGLDEALRLIAEAGESPQRMEGSSMTTLTIAARTETGSVRESNQDAVIAGERIVGVADGMGGAAGGDIASSLAAAVLEAGFDGSAASELAAITRAANSAIFDRAAADSTLTGMGTTLCCAGVVADGTVVVVNVGDSRAYLLRDGDLRQITSDHTVTAEMLRRGQLDEAEAAQHPHRRVLTRVLGGGPTVEADTVTLDAADGDLLMLCTDGLSNALSNEEIAQLMTSGGTPSEITERLVDHALAADGQDNVTVVVGRLTHRSPAE